MKLQSKDCCSVQIWNHVGILSVNLSLVRIEKRIKGLKKKINEKINPFVNHPTVVGKG